VAEKAVLAFSVSSPLTYVLSAAGCERRPRMSLDKDVRPTWCCLLLIVADMIRNDGSSSLV